MEDRRPGIAIWLNPGVVPPRTPAVALGCITALERRMVHVNGRSGGAAFPSRVSMQPNEIVLVKFVKM